MSKFEAPSLQQLTEEWERDSAIDITEPGKEMIRIPTLHSKYNKYLSLHNLAKKRRENELARVRKLKWMYYNGKLDQKQLTELGLEPFQFTLKSDLSVYMDSDVDVQEAKDKVSFHDECANYCVYVMKELNNRTWQMKEYMAWERFIQGQH